MEDYRLRGLVRRFDVHCFVESVGDGLLVVSVSCMT